MASEIDSYSKSLTIQDTSEISVYTDKLTKAEAVIQEARIKKAFPKMFEGQVSLLMEMFPENNFTDNRMRDAVNHVICTYEGWDKLPNIANFIQYDKKIKIYTYKEICEIGFEGMQAIDIGQDSPRWTLIENVEKLKLKKWEKK